MYLVEAMFAALSQCQALHPDPEEDSEDEEQQLQGDVLYVFITVRTSSYNNCKVYFVECIKSNNK